MPPLPFHFTSLALPQLAAVLISAGFAVRVWNRRAETSATNELMLTLVFTIVWALMGALEFCATTLEAKIFCSKLSYLGIVGAPWALFRFACAYTGASLPRWFYHVTVPWASLILLAVFTNEGHGLVWSHVVPIEVRGEFFARYERGPGFWFNIALGYGLPAGLGATLFEPFVRAESARKKEGSGLGLSIVRRFAEAMGGEARAASRPGGGAVFTVDLPLVDPDGAASAAPRPAPAPAREISAPPAAGAEAGTGTAGPGARRALLVDDDPRGLAAGTALLRHCGCIVSTAAGGVEALALLTRQPFDVVVLDGQMDGLDGIEVTRRIRGFAPGHPNHGVPVLGFTADPSPARRSEWLAAGAGAILAKPSGLAAFAAALARHAPAAA